MTNPKKLSVKAAKAKLDEAVSAKQAEFVTRLREFRGDLQELKELVGDDALDSGVSDEIQALAKLAGITIEPGPSDLSTARVSTEQKIEFVVSQLKGSGGTMEKTALLEAARQKFGEDRPSSFLDPAIKDGPFDRCPSDKGNQRTIVLVESS
ncbi:hypothetical protein SAMN06265222_101781 [Neorhodopirellula lusitana]|uniref:Phage major capsid protein n=1 Tax=Neorhodopirellula lusitana TaxID=445327 RepID=A0ABY1PQM1_9BACT|nr:hypothetical protein [Neorhodopirellula lusitana]SMP42446.1 hypothetical protein SAMN06265222_101781 [Neorhodopirellula lusitana]